MALIKCKECGQIISDKAVKCPKCGCPTKTGNVQHHKNTPSSITPVDDEEGGRSNKWLYAVIAVLAVAFAGSGYFAYVKIFNDKRKESIVELTPDFINAIQKYDQLGVFSEGYAAVRKGNKWGYINTKGEEVIPATIDALCVGRFSEGMAFVSLGKDYYIIDTKGNTIFQGKVFYDKNTDSVGENLPYFINRMIYIPIENGYDAYDTKWKKIRTISIDEYRKIIEQEEIGDYIAFAEVINSLGKGVSQITRLKWGLRDSVGAMIFGAKYDFIGGMQKHNKKEGTISVSNGVVLVILEELDDKHFIDNHLGCEKKHYGYVDLNGNDTFTEEIKERCSNAEQQALTNYQKKIEEEMMPTFNDFCNLVDLIIQESNKVGHPYYQLPDLPEIDPYTKMKLLDVDSSEFEEEENSMLHVVYGKNAKWKHNYTLEFVSTSTHACFMVYRESGCQWVDIGFKNKADADVFIKQMSNRDYSERSFDAGMENRWGCLWQNDNGWWIISWDNV